MARMAVWPGPTSYVRSTLPPASLPRTAGAGSSTASSATRDPGARNSEGTPGRSLADACAAPREVAARLTLHPGELIRIGMSPRTHRTYRRFLFEPAVFDTSFGWILRVVDRA